MVLIKMSRENLFKKLKNREIKKIKKSKMKNLAKIKKNMKLINRKSRMHYRYLNNVLNSLRF